jgi:hypothetical protein
MHQREDYHAKKQSGASGIELAAVCGLYCGACSWFIATTEEPERLKRLAGELHFSEEESRCYGCRSGKRLPYCEKCKMSACAAERHIDFCSECEEFPCNELKQFQSATPHRIELWTNLERIKSVGHQRWLKEIREHYTVDSLSRRPENQPKFSTCVTFHEKETTNKNEKTSAIARMNG